MADYTFRMTGAKCPECESPVRAKILRVRSAQMTTPQERPRGFSCSACQWQTSEPTFFD